MSAEQWCGLGLLAGSAVTFLAVFARDAVRAVRVVREVRRGEQTVVARAEQLTHAEWERAERDRAVWESMIQRLNDGGSQ